MTTTKPNTITAALHAALGQRVVLTFDDDDVDAFAWCTIEHVDEREVMVREGRVRGAFPIEHVTSVLAF